MSLLLASSSILVLPSLGRDGAEPQAAQLTVFEPSEEKFYGLAQAVETGRVLLEVSTAWGPIRRREGSPGDAGAVDLSLGCGLFFIQVLPSFTSPLFGSFW